MCLLFSGFPPIRAEEFKEREEIVSLRDENAKIYAAVTGDRVAVTDIRVL